jgi:SAM-dependent methyltransferase
MSRKTASLDPAYFDGLYAADPDPWKFATSDYEREKYAATLAILPAGQFTQALEVGCSIGVFTRQLARRCEALLALDVAEAALARARIDRPAHVEFARRRIPNEWPDGVFDLIVFSEMLYYLDRSDLALTAKHARAALAPGGFVLMVHFLGLTNYPLSGDDAANAFIAETRLTPVRQTRTPGYRLDLLG